MEAVRQLAGRRSALFLDDGGVLNDNRLRGPEWLRLIGEFMPARLGGTVERWASANQQVFPTLWASLMARMSTFQSNRAFQAAYALEWMRGMCDAAGVQCPPDDEAIALHRELGCYVAAHADTAIEGAGDAVRTLHRAGYVMHTASGAPSWELKEVLSKMGIVTAFSGLYGPDLVDHVKYGPGYYERVFADAQIEPGRALVLESDLECCNWARDAGAQAVWVDFHGAGDVASLANLTQALLEGT